MTSTMGQKLVQRLADKLAPSGATGTVRPDLHLAEWQRSGRNSARLLVGWGPGLKQPSLDAVDHFVLTSWEGHLKLHMASVRTFPQQRALTCIVSEMRPTRRLADANSMAKVGPGRYLEVKAATDSRHIWEVREGEDGSKYLVMLQPTNLDEVLEERRKAIKYRKADVVDWDDIAEASSTTVIDPGDRVKFYHRGLLKEGTVASLWKDDVKIKTPAGHLTVQRSAVVDVVMKDPITLDDQKDRARAYWIRVFGKEYVDKWLGPKEG